MHSFPVRLLCVLTIPLVVFISRWCARSPDSPPVHLLSPPSVISTPRPVIRTVAETVESPEVFDSDPLSLFQVYTDYYTARVFLANQQTGGKLIPLTQEVILNTKQSYSLGMMRIPAWKGLDRLLATYPNKPRDVIEEHERILDIYFTAATQQGDTFDDSAANILFLADKYHLPPFDSLESP